MYKDFTDVQRLSKYMNLMNDLTLIDNRTKL